MQLRLQVILSRAGIASRRGAETLIEEGKVSVNGKVVDTLGAKADPERDVITVSGRKIEISRQSRYILVNKPEGTITSKSDPEGRPTVMELLPKELHDLHPIGRLDWATEGVLLFTDDGTLTHALTHPSFEVERVYHVKLKGKLGENDAVKWLEGATLEDGLARAETAEIIGSTGKHTWLQITLHEGKNREVRRLAEALGYDVIRLRRHSFAGLSLEGVPPGGYRFLDLEEIERLRYISKEAGALIEEKPVAAPPEGVALSGQVVATKGHRGALAYDLTPRGISPTTERGTTRVEGFDEEGNPLPRALPPPKPEEYIGRHGTRTWVSDDAQKQRPARPPREEGDWRDKAPEVKDRVDNARRENRFSSFREGDRPQNRDDRPRREGGFSRGNDERPRREGGFSRGNDERPRREGGFSRGPGNDRPRREGFSRSDNSDRPREGGFPRGNNERPRREGGFSRSDSNDRPRREGGFSRGNDERPRREYRRDDAQGEQRPRRDNERAGDARGERKSFAPRSDRPNRDDQRRGSNQRSSNNNTKSPRPKHRGKTRD